MLTPCPCPWCVICRPKPPQPPAWTEQEAQLLQHAFDALEQGYLRRVRSERLSWSERANFEERLGELRRAHLRILELVA